jgi:hypothetical protein
VQIDQLTDSSGMFASLINCRVTSDKLLCGLVYFRGGLSGQIKVSSGDRSFNILVPEQVKTLATGLVISHPENKIEIDYAA